MAKFCLFDGLIMWMLKGTWSDDPFGSLGLNIYPKKIPCKIRVEKGAKSPFKSCSSINPIPVGGGGAQHPPI